MDFEYLGNLKVKAVHELSGKELHSAAVVLGRQAQRDRVVGSFHAVERAAAGQPGVRSHRHGPARRRVCGNAGAARGHDRALGVPPGGLRKGPGDLQQPGTDRQPNGLRRRRLWRPDGNRLPVHA